MSNRLYQTNRGRDNWLLYDTEPKFSTIAYEYIVASWKVNTTATSSIYDTKYFKIYDPEEDYDVSSSTSTPYANGVGILRIFKQISYVTDIGIVATSGVVSNPDASMGNCMRYGPFTGTFSAGNWTFITNYLKTYGQTTAKFRTSIDVFKSPNVDGTGATKLTSTPLLSPTVTSGANVTQTATAVSTYLTTTAVWNAPAITLNNEYIYVKPALEFTSAASNVVLHQLVLSSKSNPSPHLSTPSFSFSISGNTSTGGLTTLSKNTDQKTLASNLHSLSPDTIVTLFKLDATEQGAGILYFHPGVNELNTDIIFDNQIYYRYPLEASGFEWTSSGSLPRPTLRIANLDGVVTALSMQHRDFLGATLYRIRTFVKYLDATNFSSGVNPLADPAVRFPDEIWTIDRKSKENRDLIEFELSAAFDVSGVQLPRRQCIQNSCTWKYRRWDTTTNSWKVGEPSCPYTGINMYNIHDIQVYVNTEDTCSKTLSSCEKRFGTNAQLPFGGFPGVGLIR